MKCICCNCLIKNGERVCKTCRTTKMITGNNAVKKYKISKIDIYNYYHGSDATDHFIYGYKYYEHYLITDIEKLATLKHTDIHGIKFLHNLKKNDDIESNIKILHEEYPSKIDKINETKKLLSKNNDLTCSDVVNKIKDMCCTEEKMDSLINKLIIKSLCTKTSLIKNNVITKKEFDLFQNNSNCDVFFELYNTFKYKNFMENFNYGSFNELTIEKINFVDLFLDEVKHIINEEMSEVYIKIKKEHFAHIVKELIGNKKLYPKYVDTIKKIRMDYVSDKKSKKDTVDLLYKLAQEIDKTEKESIDLEFKKTFFSVFIGQYKYDKHKIMEECHEKFMNDTMTITEMRTIANNINDEYIKNIILEFKR